MKILLLISFLFSIAHARELSMTQKMDDFNELVSRVRSGYGPLEYKEKLLGISLNDLEQKYTTLIEQTKTNSEFYYLLVKFVAEFKDSHFGARLPSTHKSYLGFRTDLINNKVLIETIDRKVLSESDFPFEKGDEIVSFNGVKPMEIIKKELYPYMGQGSDLTALRTATSLLAFRHASIVPVKQGEVKLEIRKGNSDFLETVSLEWKLGGEPLDEFIDDTKMIPRYVLRPSPVEYDQIQLKMDPFIERDFRCSGATRTKIPEDATIIMKKPFTAYYHPTEKGNIGYLRIPHYSPRESDPKIDAYELRFSQYEYAIAKLEENTVGLIIDQDHNCGGSVGYLHQIVSLFAEKPFAPTQFELLANKSSYLSIKNWVDDKYKYTLGYENYLEVINLVKETWLNEESFLTKKFAIDGTKEIYPHSVRYTKPIIVLIDEFSGSGGDAFPAMMQGLGRAKLLGTRTMGAGGHVQSLPPLSNSMINVAITRSLFYHPNDVAIENNGASPDIKYTPTRDDFLYEYRGYQKFYLNELFKLLEENDKIL